jgi:uncharacterized RDD family membrane protein YckC
LRERGRPTRRVDRPILDPMAFEPPVEAMSSPVYASWGQRFVAWSLDGILVWGSIFVASSAVAIAVEDALSGIALFALLALLAPLYYAFFHARHRGQTLGNRAVGIAVRNAKTLERISLRRALARAYVVAILWWMAWTTIPLILDYLWPLWDPKRQTWHDKVAVSVVVRV